MFPINLKLRVPTGLFILPNGNWKATLWCSAPVPLKPQPTSAMPTATAVRPVSSTLPACQLPPSLPNQRLRIKPSRHTRNKRAAIVGSRPFSYHQSTGLGLWQDKVGFQTGIGSMQKIQHLYFLIFHLQRQPNLPGGVRRKADRASILQLDPIGQIRNIADVVGVVLLLAVGRNQLYF